MTLPFGKYVTVVKLRFLGMHDECGEWCRDNIGEKGWDVWRASNIYTFDRPEDATAFRLRFE